MHRDRRLHAGTLSPTRREMLGALAALALAQAASCRSGHREPARTRPLEEDERAALQAACARLLPVEGGPGPREAGVIHFIERQLSQPAVAVFERELRAGARMLDLSALATSGRSFASLGPAEQDALLGFMAAGDASAPGFSSAHFFELLLTLTIEGMFSDPVHGGNRGGAGWTLLGWEPPNPRPGSPHHGR